jgi:hypothetical protein
VDAALKLGVVGYRAADRNLASGMRINSAADQLSRVNQQTGGHAFLETVALEVSHLLSDQNQVARRLLVDFAFVDEDIRFEWRRGIIELKADETLAS